MIQDLDETVKALLVQKVPIDTASTDIQFERPTTEWENQLAKPTVNCFLYDIRENLIFRDNERYITRNGNTGTTTTDPIRMDLTYLITVWSKDITDEHRILGDIMRVLVSYPTIPQNVLQGSMVNQSKPLRTWVALPEDTPNTWDFWGANEWRLKAGVNYRVTVAVEPVPVEVDLVTEKVIQLEHLQSS